MTSRTHSIGNDLDGGIAQTGTAKGEDASTPESGPASGDSVLNFGPDVVNVGMWIYPHLIAFEVNRNDLQATLPLTAVTLILQTPDRKVVILTKEATTIRTTQSASSARYWYHPRPNRV